MTNKTRRRKTSERPSGPALSWKYSVLTIICGSILVAGFFFAARQHFSSMDLGLKNSKLRKQLDELDSEKRRLLLSREISMAPSEIMRVARKIGFNQYAAPEQTKAASIEPQLTAAEKPKITKAADPAITQKTVINKPVVLVKAAAETDSARVVHQAKKEQAPAKDKKYKS